MAFMNNMSKLLNKLERRLGTRPLNLPEHLSKEVWADVITEETLVTFSRYFPHKIRFEISERTCFKKGDFFVIDEELFPGIQILGVRDIAWEEFTPASGYINNQSYGIYDFFANSYGLEDIAMVQMRADQASLFNNGVYVEFEYPNRIAIKSATNINLVHSINQFKVDLLIVHSDNLNTISPTKMELFEELAKADIANFLYQELKYFDGLETVFSSVDIKLSDIETMASRREEMIQKMEESYVSASNENQPIIWTV